MCNVNYIQNVQNVNCVQADAYIDLDAWDGKGNTAGMNTAISLPKHLFDKAERLVVKARKSRSQLYSKALHEHVARHLPDRIIGALDRAIEENGLPKDFVANASQVVALDRSPPTECTTGSPPNEDCPRLGRHRRRTRQMTLVCCKRPRW